jgi:hypothetical protein
VNQKKIRGFGCELVFCFSNPAKKNTSEVARDFVVQTKVRALFHYIQGVPEFPYKGGIWPIVHLALIVPYALRVVSAADAGWPSRTTIRTIISSK